MIDNTIRDAHYSNNADFVSSSLVGAACLRLPCSTAVCRLIVLPLLTSTCSSPCRLLSTCPWTSTWSSTFTSSLSLPFLLVVYHGIVFPVMPFADMFVCGAHFPQLPGADDHFSRFSDSSHFSTSFRISSCLMCLSACSWSPSTSICTWSRLPICMTIEFRW